MSISCELLAEPAVLPGVPNGPFFRFTPHADQRRLERTCDESFLSPMERTVFLPCSAAPTVLPRPAVGFGSVMGCNPLRFIRVCSSESGTAPSFGQGSPLSEVPPCLAAVAVPTAADAEDPHV